MLIIQKRLPTFHFIRPNRTPFVHSVFNNNLVINIITT